LYNPIYDKQQQRQQLKHTPASAEEQSGAALASRF
jgi:hypothetical protein